MNRSITSSTVPDDQIQVPSGEKLTEALPAYIALNSNSKPGKLLLMILCVYIELYLKHFTWTNSYEITQVQQFPYLVQVLMLCDIVLVDVFVSFGHDNTRCQVVNLITRTPYHMISYCASYHVISRCKSYHTIILQILLYDIILCSLSHDITLQILSLYIIVHTLLYITLRFYLMISYCKSYHCWLQRTQIVQWQG